jgi:hypothetical protein
LCFCSIITVLTVGDVANGQPPLGLHGPGYQWIGLHSYMYSALWQNATGGIEPLQYQFAQGLIGLQNYRATNSDIYRAYSGRWADTPPQPDLPSVVPSDPASMTSPSDFAYDAVWFFARALDKLERTYNVSLEDGALNASPELKSAFLDIMKGVSFDGVTGRIVVDQRGDRQLAPFDLVNIQGSEVVTVGTVSFDGHVSFFPDRPLQYMGGSKAADTPARYLQEIPLVERVVLTVLTGVLLGLVGLALLVLYAFRKEAVFKAASPPFLGLVLVGVATLVASMVPRVYENYKGGSVKGCVAEVFLTNFGYTLIAGSLLLKSYRVDSIFRMRQFHKRILTNGHLLSGVCGLMLLEMAILLTLLYGEPLFLERSPFDEARHLDYIHCSSNAPDTWMAVLLAARFALLFVTAIYAFRIRNIPDEFSQDAKHNTYMHAVQASYLFIAHK